MQICFHVQKKRAILQLFDDSAKNFILIFFLYHFMMKYSGVTFLAPLDWVEGGCPPFRATVDRMLWHIHIHILLSRMLSLRLKVNLEKLEPRIGHRLDLPRFTRIPVQGKIGFLCSVSGSHVLHVLLPSLFFFFLFVLLTLQWKQIWEILGMWGLIFEVSPQCFEFFFCYCCCFCVYFLRFCLLREEQYNQ